MGKKRLGLYIGLTILVLILVPVYLYLLFPIIDKDHDAEPVVTKTELWRTGRDDSLGYYYLERPAAIPIEQLMRDRRDSIFVVDFSRRNRRSIALKNRDGFIQPFTNNYSSRTLYCYSLYLRTKDRRYLDIFLESAWWMYHHAIVIADTAALWTNENLIYQKYNLKFGWPSAYAQGFGLSVLCRAYQVTGDAQFILLAKKIVNSFQMSYVKGGILDVDKRGDSWYLEYPADPPPYVLNGMIFGMFGLYDFYRLTGAEKAKILFDKGVATLEKNLHRYDMGYWSSYDLLFSDYCAGYNYHKNIHIPQLKVLYRITGNDVFKTYYQRFEKYLGEPYYSLFKIQFTLDAVHRRLTYKKPF